MEGKVINLVCFTYSEYFLSIRYEECFRVSQGCLSFKIAWLLWPDSNLWPTDGEIDFPEVGNLESDISAFMHYANASGGQDAFGTSVNISDNLFHTIILEWTEGQVLFYLDGNLVGNSTTEVPSNSMHRVWQSETRLSGGPPVPTDSAQIDLAWAVVYTQTNQTTSTTNAINGTSTTNAIPVSSSVSVLLQKISYVLFIISFIACFLF